MNAEFTKETGLHAHARWSLAYDMQTLRTSVNKRRLKAESFYDLKGHVIDDLSAFLTIVEDANRLERKE